MDSHPIKDSFIDHACASTSDFLNETLGLKGVSLRTCVDRDFWDSCQRNLNPKFNWHEKIAEGLNREDRACIGLFLEDNVEGFFLTRAFNVKGRVELTAYSAESILSEDSPLKGLVLATFLEVNLRIAKKMHADILDMYLPIETPRFIGQQLGFKVDWSNPNRPKAEFEVTEDAKLAWENLKHFPQQVI